MSNYSENIFEKVEKLFNFDKQNFIPMKKQEIFSNKNIILSAPHDVKLIREDGTTKMREPMTGAIIKYLINDNKILNGIVRITGETDNEYIERVKQIISEYKKVKCIIDIHGMKDTNNCDLVIGTGGEYHESLCGNIEILNSVINVSEKLGLKYKINEVFCASGENTIAKRIYRISSEIPVVQMEFSYNIRINKTEKFIEFFEELINNFKEGEI